MNLIGISANDPRNAEKIASYIKTGATVMPIDAAARRAAAEGFGDDSLAAAIAAGVGRERLRSRWIDIVSTIMRCPDIVVVPDVGDDNDVAMVEAMGGRMA